MSGGRYPPSHSMWTLAWRPTPSTRRPFLLAAVVSFFLSPAFPARCCTAVAFGAPIAYVTVASVAFVAAIAPEPDGSQRSIGSGVPPHSSIRSPLPAPSAICCHPRHHVWPEQRLPYGRPQQPRALGHITDVAAMTLQIP